MQPVEPIHTVELFPGLSRELLGVLKSLSPQEWMHPTVCEGWTVKDVVAHLLGGNLGRLSSGRDGFSASGGGPMSYQELVAFIDEENAHWVHAARRISPPLLVEFLEITDAELYRYFQSLPAEAEAAIPVSWAGDERSPNWFDIAREYTEKWLHQQHIREASGRPLLVGRRWLYPVLDTFLRALPQAYRNVGAAEGALLGLTVSGESGGEWSLLRQKNAWVLLAGRAAEVNTRLSLDADTAWRLFTRGTGRDEAQSRLIVEGDPSLALAFLDVVAIMA